jgi:hypothetical protein
VKGLDGVKMLLLLGLVRRKFVRAEVLMAVSVSIRVFWAVMYSLEELTACILYQ